MIERALLFTVMFGLAAPAAACPLPNRLRPFKASIPVEALPEISGSDISKPQARLLLAQLEDFRQEHLEGYRRALGRYGAYVVETDRVLERNRKSCQAQYQSLHSELKQAFADIAGLHRDHYRKFAARYKTRVRYARQVLFF